MSARLALALFLLLPGCFLFRAGGGPDGSYRRGYDFERTLLWQACVEAIQNEGYSLAVADAINGRIKTAIQPTRSGEGLDVELWLGGKPADWSLTVQVTRYSRIRDQWSRAESSVLLEERVLGKIEQKAQELYRQSVRVR